MDITQPEAPKTRKGRERRAQLVDCAARAFAVQGYRKVSLAAIAAEVGITEQGAMHYFPTKQDLLAGVLDRHDLGDATEYQRHFADAPNALDGLISATRYRMEHQQESARLISVLMAESVDPEHPAHEWFVERNRRIRRQVGQILSTAQAQGEIDVGVDVAAIAAEYVALFDGLVVQWSLDHDAFDVIDAVGRYFERLR